MNEQSGGLFRAAEDRARSSRETESLMAYVRTNFPTSREGFVYGLLFGENLLVRSTSKVRLPHS